jgi:hypothetical protein
LRVPEPKQKKYVNSIRNKLPKALSGKEALDMLQEKEQLKIEAEAQKKKRKEEREIKRLQREKEKEIKRQEKKGSLKRKPNVLRRENDLKRLKLIHQKKILKSSMLIQMTTGCSQMLLRHVLNVAPDRIGGMKTLG